MTNPTSNEDALREQLAAIKFGVDDYDMPVTLGDLPGELKTIMQLIRTDKANLLRSLLEEKRVYGYDENGEDDYAVPVEIIKAKLKEIEGNQ